MRFSDVITFAVRCASIVRKRAVGQQPFSSQKRTCRGERGLELKGGRNQDPSGRLAMKGTMVPSCILTMAEHVIRLWVKIGPW